jgi:hypothetical protein
MIALPIGYLLTMRFVNEFLASARSASCSCSQRSRCWKRRFCATSRAGSSSPVFAYILIVKGLFWVTMPYLLRDQIAWASRTTAVWISINALALLYGATILFLALTQY